MVSSSGRPKKVSVFQAGVNSLKSSIGVGVYAMPAMFAGFMLMLPSGLVFYIFVSTVIGIAQQYYIKRKFAQA